MFIISGKNSKNRNTVINIKPEIKNILFFLFKTIRRKGKRIIGNSFVIKEHPKVIPEKTILEFSIKISSDFFENIINKVNERKNMTEESIWPEPAISITGKGCHAYKIDFHDGMLIFFKILIMIMHVNISITTSINFMLIIVLLKNALMPNNICAAGG